MSTKLQTWLRSIARHPVFRPALIAVTLGIVTVSLIPVQDLSYDLSFRVKPRSAITNAVLVVANQETLNNLGTEHGYVKRSDHARLLDRLSHEGAKLVFYDFVFSESDAVAEVDQALALAISNHGAVVLVAASEDSNEQNVALKTALSPPIPL